MMNNRVSVTS